MSDLCKCGHTSENHSGGCIFGGAGWCDCEAFDSQLADRDDLAAIVAQATDCMDCEGTGKDVVRFDKDMNPVEWGTCHRCGAVASMVLESDWLRGIRAKELRDAADAVKEVRDRGLPPSCHSHPTHQYIENWLRDRADRVDAEDGGR